ncbi:MAG TPA: maleylpyruvate isomerase family mycothiol-dependent enzyme [Acidimicrobiia bacterium]|nr:maleylpyruvate isomerase family mycothiol-dependent enzyme [Acidimicrobiia bacterium]
MKEPLIARFEECWTDIADLCGDLSDDQWDLLTECPGWSVRDQLAHMIGTERMLLGEQPADGTEPAESAPHIRNDIGKVNERWVATYGDFAGKELVDEFKSVTSRRLMLLGSMSAEEWDKDGFTPEGPGPYRLFMEIRVFDCWYHDQDIREAIGRPGYLEGPVADLSIGRIPRKGLPYVVGKKAAAPAGSTVAFEIHGVPQISAAVSVPPEGRAVLLDDVPDDPTVRIITDRRTFTRLAGGRWSGDHARTHGAVHIDGDTDLGNRVIDNMAFTI